MHREYFERFFAAGILIALLAASFFLLKPILISVFIALVLGYLFYPLYEKVAKWTKSPNLSALIMCLVLISVIVLPIWFLTPLLLEQSFEFFKTSQQLDFVIPLKKIFPDILASEDFSREAGAVLSSFLTNASLFVSTFFASIIRNLPNLLLQLTVLFFTFFIALRDQKIFVEYTRSILPFPDSIKDKFFESSRGITVSIIYGRIFLGIVQGLVAGAGFFIFGLPNALFLTTLAILAGVFPIVGTGIVWVPAGVSLIVNGNTYAAIGVAIFGVFAAILENLVQPILLARWMKMNSALTIISMIGGLFAFGVIGLVVGPLIIAYLLIVLEIYRDKRLPGVLEPPSKKNTAKR